MKVITAVTALQMMASPDMVAKVVPLQDDPDSKDMFHMQLCEACQERSRRCQDCKWLNSHYSLVELQELEAIRGCVEVTIDPLNPEKEIILASYPFIGDLKTLYAP